MERGDAPPPSSPMLRPLASPSPVPPTKLPKRKKRLSVLQRGLSRSANDLTDTCEEFEETGKCQNSGNSSENQYANFDDQSLQCPDVRMESTVVKGQSQHSIFGYLKSRLQRHHMEHYTLNQTTDSSSEPTPRSTPSGSPQLQRFVPFNRKRNTDPDVVLKLVEHRNVENEAPVLPINHIKSDVTGSFDLCKPKILTSLDSLEDFGDRPISEGKPDYESYQNGIQSKDINDSDIQKEISRAEHELALRTFELFDLKVTLLQARNLLAKDACGTSDPYVKIKHKNRLLHKSKVIDKNLNPVWDEHFAATVDDAFAPLYVKVFDYDFGFPDDFLGSGFIDLTNIGFNRPKDVTLYLKENPSSEARGELDLTITICPKTVEEHETQIHRQRSLDQTRKMKNQIWSAVVTVILVEGYRFTTKDGGVPGRPYVRFKLGQEKWKSKGAQRSANPSWREQFDFHLFEDQPQLEVNYYDKESRNRDEPLGRCVIDLSNLEREKTHRIRQNLKASCPTECDISDTVGSLFLLLTISGSTSTESISDLTAHPCDPYEAVALRRRYGLLRTFDNMRDVGHLTVKVFRARGLAAADIGGKSDPYCVLELDNARLQTQTEYRTLTPTWNKIFTFQVKDINSSLEVTVYDEDRSMRSDFLGKVIIPLLRVNNGERRWYMLKDSSLRSVARGSSPQILMELGVVWNPIRGAIQTLRPKEQKFMETEERFSRKIFMTNVLRLKAVGMEIYSFTQTFESIMEWESPTSSIVAFVLFIVGTYYFEPYMVPLVFLPMFVKSYVINSVTSGRSGGYRDVDASDLSGESAEDDEDEKEEKKSLKMRLQAIQEVTQTVQNSIGYVASMGECVKNTFNFTVPFLSWLAVFLLVASSFLLYLIPVRWLVMILGTVKFTKKLVRPTSVPNNEFLDFLSRVPDKELLIQARDLSGVDPSSQSERKRKEGVKSKK